MLRSGQLRGFSTSRTAFVDLSSFYSKITSWRRKTPAAPVQDPTAKGEAAADDSTESGPRRLPVLGKPKTVEEDWPAVREFAEFRAWPTNHYRRDLTETEIDQALSGVPAGFGSIREKFESIKLISSQLRLAIPDSVLTSVKTVPELREYLVSRSKPFDERQPDAIYLDQQDFVGTNVVIEDPVAQRKLEKRRRHELLAAAREQRKKSVDALME